MESHRKGELTEAVVVAELKRRGIPVSRPFGDNERYDVVAETPGGVLLKLQVKTGRFERGTVVFDGVSMHTNSRGNVYKPYDGDVDYFAIYCHELEELYLVSEQRVGSSMTLRVESPEQPDPKINPAEEYQFDRRWPPDESDEYPEDGIRTTSKERSVTHLVESLEGMGVTAYRKTHGAGVCDVVAEAETGPVRLTVRTGTESEGRIRLSRTPNVEKRRDTDETDYYALYCPSREQTYLVASDEFGASLSLRTDDPEQIQHDSRWAEDYRLEAVWPPDGVPRVGSKSAVGAVRDRFESLGIPVGVVHEESVPYDLLAAAGDGFQRVAIVPAWRSRGCLRLKPDRVDDIDAYVLYHRESDTCYAVDADQFDRSISLRVDPPAKPDPRINDAAAFELERNWA
jgi:Holliday junction resolvase